MNLNEWSSNPRVALSKHDTPCIVGLDRVQHQSPSRKSALSAGAAQIQSFLELQKWGYHNGFLTEKVFCGKTSHFYRMTKNSNKMGSKGTCCQIFGSQKGGVCKAEVVRYLDADAGKLLHDVRFAFLLRTSVIVFLPLKVTPTFLGSIHNFSSIVCDKMRNPLNALQS